VSEIKKVAEQTESLRLSLVSSDIYGNRLFRWKGVVKNSLEDLCIGYDYGVKRNRDLIKKSYRKR
jgi:hypothetical protein